MQPLQMRRIQWFLLLRLLHYGGEGLLWLRDRLMPRVLLSIRGLLRELRIKNETT